MSTMTPERQAAANAQFQRFAAMQARKPKPVGAVERHGVVHVMTGSRMVNGMPFAATKCFLNFLGEGTFTVTEAQPTCGTCTKV